MKTQFSLKSMFLAVTILCLLLFLWQHVGIAFFHYPDRSFGATMFKLNYDGCLLFKYMNGAGGTELYIKGIYGKPYICRNMPCPV